jgi:anthranilate phosphoribosyltransferase
MALYCAEPSKGILDAVGRAREALQSGKAFESFRKLIAQ